LCLGLLLRFGDPTPLVIVALGICIGFSQWAIALKGIVNGVSWTLATVIASLMIVAAQNYIANQQLIPPILDYYNPGCLSASCDSYKLAETWLTGTIIIIFIASLSVALPTGIVLSRDSARIYIWLFGIIVASTVGVLGYIALSVNIRGPLLETVCY